MLSVNNFDVSGMVYQATWTEKHDNSCSVLSFSLPAEQAEKFSCGDTVVFTWGGVNVFYGYLFEVDRDSRRASCTAYDQLHDLKARASLIRKGETLTGFAARVLAHAGNHIRVGKLAETDVPLTLRLFGRVSYMNMLKQSIKETQELSGECYILRDEFGVVTLHNLLDLRTDLVVGDGGEEGPRDAAVSRNTALVTKWDKLSTARTLRVGSMVETSVLARHLLAEPGREQETVSLECVGDLRLRMGCEIRLAVAQAGLDLRAVITSAEHNFSGDTYTTKLTLERSVW